MLPRSVLLRSLQRTVTSQSRAYSAKANTRPPPSNFSGIGKNSDNIRISQPAASSKSPSPVLGNAVLDSSVVNTNTSRNRKLTPTAKAKAAASASRALREQIGALGSASSVHNEGPSTSANTTSIPTSHLTGVKEMEDLEESVHESPKKLHDAHAYATADNYDLEKLMASSRLPPGWQYLEDSEVIHVPSWPFHTTNSGSSSISAASGEVFIFRSGSYVTWGLNSEQSRRFHRAVIQGRPSKAQSVERESYSKVGDEAMEYLIADDQITRVVGDVMVIGQAPRMEPNEFDSESVEEFNSSTEDSTEWSPLLARLAFSQGLSRSARLSVQEAALSTYLEEVAAVPERLERESRVPLHRKEIIRKMGTLLKLRQRANLDSENFLDDPEMYWENWKAEHHYDSICHALDIETRFKAFNEKLNYGENLLGNLRALLTEASTHRMEVIIIGLIAFEVLIALVSHGVFAYLKKEWDMIRGKQSEEMDETTEEESSSLIDQNNANEQLILSSLRRLLHNQDGKVTADITPRLV